MFGYNFTTLIIILVIALLLFGPRRLPELGESIGKAIKSFKKAHDDRIPSIPRARFPAALLPKPPTVPSAIRICRRVRLLPPLRRGDQGLNRGCAQCSASILRP